jgi:pimeloyl-ACP methyl ester carboxylesterase
VHRGVLATDFRDDLERFDVPTLVIHGDDDQGVPFSVRGQASAALIDGATLKVNAGAPHGVSDAIGTRAGSTSGEDRAAIESEFARAPEDIRRRIRWLPLGVEVELAGNQEEA